VPVKGSRNLLSNDQTLPLCSTLKVEDIMELTQVCVKNIHFQVDDKFFQRKEGIKIGSFLCPVVRNIFMEHFERLALDSAAEYKQVMRLRHM
jgi:hypothetical protein